MKKGQLSHYCKSCLNKECDNKGKDIEDIKTHSDSMKEYWRKKKEQRYNKE